MKKYILLFCLLSFPSFAQCVGALQANNNLSDVCNAATARSNIGAGTGSGSVTSVAAGAGLSFSTITTTGTAAASTNTLTGGFAYVIDGGGSAITTSTCSFTSGQLCTFQWPYACTLAEVSMLADQTGSIVVEVAKTTYANYAPGTHPVAGDKITSSTPPTISSASKSDDTTLSSWTTTISAGDIYGLSVTSASTVTRVVVNFRCTKP